MSHMTCDTWHVTPGLWQVTRDTWHMLWGVNFLSKFQPPSSYGLWFMIYWRMGWKGLRTDFINEWMTKVFVEQPQLYQVCKSHSLTISAHFCITFANNNNNYLNILSKNILVYLFFFNFSLSNKQNFFFVKCLNIFLSTFIKNAFFTAWHFFTQNCANIVKLSDFSLKNV